jgi:hypothetical protein
MIDTVGMTLVEQEESRVIESMLDRLEGGHIEAFNDHRLFYPTVESGHIDLRDHEIRVKGDTRILNFRKCDFTYSTIIGQFIDTDFSGSIFKLTDDTNATFKNCNFTDCIIDFDTSLSVAVALLLEYDRLPHFQLDRRYAAGYLMSESMWVSAGIRVDLEETDRKDRPSKPYKYILENFSVSDVFCNLPGWGLYNYKNQVQPI